MIFAHRLYLPEVIALQPLGDCVQRKGSWKLYGTVSIYQSKFFSCFSFYKYNNRYIDNTIAYQFFGQFKFDFHKSIAC